MSSDLCFILVKKKMHIYTIHTEGGHIDGIKNRNCYPMYRTSKKPTEYCVLRPNSSNFYQYRRLGPTPPPSTKVSNTRLDCQLKYFDKKCIYNCICG